MTDVRSQTRCPSLLIAIAGPWMCVLGAVFLDHPVVQPLTDYIWVGDRPQQPSRLKYVARVFHCISLAREELKSYYEKNSVNVPSPGQRSALFYPSITHYLDSTNHRVEFVYTAKLAKEHPSKAIFAARTVGTEQQEPKAIVVKFVQSYNAEAHELLSSNGNNLAPRLLYNGYKLPEGQVGPDLWMIVMDFVPGVDLDLLGVSPMPEVVKKDVERAIRVLHEHGFVFGDLRPPNVMAVKDNDGKIKGGMLIDFDWCGMEDEGLYPVLMNSTLEWASGMGPEEKMYKQHDDEMLEKM